ncbi:helix-turn-helix transcriptional regulator [Mucilaginibacter calamicampi]|uniref:Helix-turn-helix transcriptional regulator n=1 Tax=Mucilaginibacter calamicampi TaxID=1302352 RepID=A0ABW2YV52_9SPHI
MSLNVITEISSLTPAQTAGIVKKGRLEKPLTQKELADLSGISLRSLQRIENAEVLPRLYTLRLLAKHINLDISSSSQSSPVSEASIAIPLKPNLARKWILSISSLVFIVLSFSAFVIQSPTFPENLFETVNMVRAGCIIYTVILYNIWK